MLKQIIGKIWRRLPQAVQMKIVRVTQSEFTVSAAVVVQNERDEILLLDHVLRSGSGWGIPGGFLARGEQPEQAARRELCEEIGLEITNIKLFCTRTIDRHIEIVFHARSNGTAEVKSAEIFDFGWFKLGEMPKKMSQSQKLIIEELLKNNL